VSRRRASVDLAAVLGGVAADEPDELDRRVLDAAEALLRSAGLRRWTVDDVVARAGVGRMTVYRRFGGRDELVHAVLARELRATLDGMVSAAAGVAGLEAQAVAAVTAALRSLDGSVVDSLLRSDSATFLPYLTTEAGPLLALARTAISAWFEAAGAPASPELAEAAARLGLSLILTRDTVLPLHDADALGEATRRIVRPFLALGAPVAASA
jgi:AcrR family transcriptional regulator